MIYHRIQNKSKTAAEELHAEKAANLRVLPLEFLQDSLLGLRASKKQGSPFGRP